MFEMHGIDCLNKTHLMKQVVVGMMIVDYVIGGRVDEIQC
jgi:hypothetical protein